MTKIFSCLSLFSLLLFFSCSDDTKEEEKPTLPPVFKIEVKSSYNGFNNWVFVSGPTGEVIGTKKIVLNSIDSIRVPDSHKQGDVYSLTLISTWPDYYLIDSYLAIEPTHIVLDSKSKVYMTKGTHTVTINNPPDKVKSFGAFGKNVYVSTGYAIPEKCFLSSQLLDEPADIYYFFAENTEDAPRYLRFPNARLEETITKEYSEMVPMENKTVFQFSESDQASYDFNGFRDSYEYAYGLYSLSKSAANTSSLSVYYPNFTLPEYSLNVSVKKGKLTHSHMTISSVPSQFKTVNGNISSFSTADGVISLQSTGTFDVITALAGTEIFAGNGAPYYKWTVHMPQALKTGYKLPVLPDEIKNTDENLKDYHFEFYKINMHDFSALTDYNGYINKKLELNESLYNTSKEILVKTTDLN